MDLVIPYHLPPHGDHELQFALRSACENVDVGRVWLLGDCPEWCVGVEHIPGGDDTRDRNWNVMTKLRGLLAREDCPDEFVLWNDDFYVLQPCVGLRPTVDARHTLADIAGKLIGQYKRAAENTLALTGAECPSFELHKPMCMRAAWLNMWSEVEKPVFMRTLAARVSAEFIDDALPSENDRLATNPDHVRELMQGPWFASSDRMACDSAFVLPMRKRFQDKCRFER